MTEKFILVSLEDEKSKKLAEVISNKTSRRILEYLSEKEGTSTDISRELGIALSTVEYNLKNLVKAELVDAGEFRWSPKGRQQDIYKVKKKYIVIAPGKSTELKEVLNKILPVGIVGIIAAGVIEYMTRGGKILQVASTKEIITRTITDRSADMVSNAESAVMASGAIADATEPIINVTSEVSQTVHDIAVSNPHYGLWFLFGLVLALILYLLFSLRKR